MPTSQEASEPAVRVVGIRAIGIRIGRIGRAVIRRRDGGADHRTRGDAGGDAAPAIAAIAAIAAVAAADVDVAVEGVAAADVPAADIGPIAAADIRPVAPGETGPVAGG